MKCSACRAQLDAYRDGDVGPSVASAVATHLNECSECQAFLDQLASLEQRLARVPRIEPRSDFTHVVMARIASLPAPVALRQRVRIWWIGVYELVAWAVLLALTAGGMLHWKSVVADAGVLLGKAGIAASDLYQVARHFHLLTFVAAGVLLECVAFAILLAAAKRYVNRLRATLPGVQTA